MQLARQRLGSLTRPTPLWTFSEGLPDPDAISEAMQWMICSTRRPTLLSDRFLRRQLWEPAYGGMAVFDVPFAQVLEDLGLAQIISKMDAAARWQRMAWERVLGVIISFADASSDAPTPSGADEFLNAGRAPRERPRSLMGEIKDAQLGGTGGLHFEQVLDLVNGVKLLVPKHGYKWIASRPTTFALKAFVARNAHGEDARTLRRSKRKQYTAIDWRDVSRRMAVGNWSPDDSFRVVCRHVSRV